MEIIAGATVLARPELWAVVRARGAQEQQLPGMVRRVNVLALFRAGTWRASC